MIDYLILIYSGIHDYVPELNSSISSFWKIRSSLLILMCIASLVFFCKTTPHLALASTNAFSSADAAYHMSHVFVYLFMWIQSCSFTLRFRGELLTGSYQKTRNWCLCELFLPDTPADPDASSTSC